MTSLTKDDWKARIGPHLSTSLQTVSEKITQTEAVQTWLHDASMEAAAGLGQVSGMQAEMQGYMRMMNDLEAELPELVAAVEELTDGYGTVDLHWRPLQPNFSRLYVDFNRDYTVKLFVRLSECSTPAAREALATVIDALPKGEPFPNRPNKITGLVARKDRSVGVRAKEHLRDKGPGTYQSVTLLPSGQDPLEKLDPAEAAPRLYRLLCSESGSS